MKFPRIALLCSLALAPVTASAAPTYILPLSGMGEPGETPVYWDFQLDTGRGSGEWKKILVPSQWEQQGFGTYYYGTQGRGKPDDDPVIPKETGTYKRSFEVANSWKDRDIILVFEAAMTDTSVLINGKSAGATHQGGFYRFSYNGSEKAYVGVMAQEVQSVAPEAVIQGSDGYLRVNYDRLGIRMQGFEEWVVGGQRIPTVRH